MIIFNRGTVPVRIEEDDTEVFRLQPHESVELWAVETDHERDGLLAYDSCYKWSASGVERYDEVTGDW